MCRWLCGLRDGGGRRRADRGTGDSPTEDPIVGHAGTGVDEQPDSGAGKLAQNGAEEKGACSLKAARPPVFECDGLYQPGEEDRKPRVAHQPQPGKRETDGVDRPPGQIVPSQHQSAHN